MRFRPFSLNLMSVLRIGRGWCEVRQHSLAAIEEVWRCENVGWYPLGVPRYTGISPKAQMKSAIC